MPCYIKIVRACGDKLNSLDQQSMQRAFSVISMSIYHLSLKVTFAATLLFSLYPVAKYEHLCCLLAG